MAAGSASPANPERVRSSTSTSRCKIGFDPLLGPGQYRNAVASGRSKPPISTAIRCDVDPTLPRCGTDPAQAKAYLQCFERLLRCLYGLLDNLIRVSEADEGGFEV